MKSSATADPQNRQGRAGAAATKRIREEQRRRPVPWGRLHLEAEKRFEVKRFRPGQREAIDAIFRGRDVLALMPTGAGKSLCYQLPALFLPDAVIVVSPLIALMRDQQGKAELAQIAVEKVDSTLTKVEAADTLEAIASGETRLIYVTPERLEKPEFVAMLAKRRVSLLAIDEAHCISQWGHDFRPAYLNLRHAREAMGNPPVIALTATATEAVSQDIVENLGMRDARVVNTGMERPNLEFAVEMAVNTDAKRARLLALLAQQEGSGIVYTASVRSADELAEWLKAHGVRAGKYHAKMPCRERESVQEAFMRGEYKVLFATKAFGLGIDKPDTRFVYHYEFPDSLETYYQEAGRAGRDGMDARAVLLYRLEDRRIQRFFMISRYPRVEDCRRVLEVLERAAALPEIAERSGLPRRRCQVILHLLRESGFLLRVRAGFRRRHEFIDDEELLRAHATFEEMSKGDCSRLDEMMRYGESGKCRKQILRVYFNEDEGQICGKCDNCRRISMDDRLPSAGHSERAVQVRTAIGVVVTTAPETLPIAEAPKFQKGDRIRHARFGSGTVLDEQGKTLMVRFDEGKARKIQSTYVKLLRKTP